MKFPYSLMSVLLAGALALPLAAQSTPAAAPGKVPASADQQVPAAPDNSAANDPLLDPDPLPATPISLVGGIVRSVDLIRDRLAIKVFGGGTMKLQFDSRSHIYRDGMETTELAIRPGERVYLDTQLDRSTGHTFARNIHVVTAAARASANGQVLEYDARSGDLILQDRISGQPIKVRVTSNTPVARHGQAASVAALRPGALVNVNFSPAANGRGDAQQVEVLAEPGGTFVFNGRVTFIDLRANLIAVDNVSDGKNYNIIVSRRQVTPALAVGSHVSVTAEFNGRDYQAQQLVVNSGPQQSSNTDPDTH